jgi:anti-anti-sigma factor
MSEITKDGDGIIVKPGQDVVASVVPELRKELQPLVGEGPKELVIDLSGVEMVDSVGIGLFIATHNSMSKSGGKFVVTNVSKDIYNLFKTMRLHQHFEVRMVEG